MRITDTIIEIFSPIKWQLLLCAAVFFLLPAIGLVIGTEMQMILALICFVANNIVITVTCVWVSLAEGFKWYFPIFVIALYVMSLIFYNPYFTPEMSVDVSSYLITAYICSIIGLIIRKIIERNR